MSLLVVVNLPKPAGKVLTLARSTLERMQGNPFFPAPPPAFFTLQADIDALIVAEAFVLSRTKGAREARNAKLALVQRDLRELAAYVQSVADANSSHGAEIVASTGFALKRPSIRTKAAFKVVAGRASGSARLFAKAAGDRAVYAWRYSTDETTWTSLPNTVQSSTTLSGLLPRTVYFFQLRVLTPHERGDWGASFAFSCA